MKLHHHLMFFVLIGLPMFGLSQVTETTITAVGVAEYTPVVETYRVHIYTKKYKSILDMVQAYKSYVAEANLDVNKVGQNVQAAVPGFGNEQYIYFYYDADSQEEVDKVTSIFFPALKYDDIEVFYQFDPKELKALMKKASDDARKRAELLAAENGKSVGKMLNATEINLQYTEGYSEDIRELTNKKRFLVKVDFEAQ